MSARPCNIVIDGCPGVDSPILNLSAEAPDRLVWAGIGWWPYHPIPLLGVGAQEPISCFNVTYSFVSQQVADIMAHLNAEFCPPQTCATGAVCQQFTNSRQEASIECANGTVFSYAIPAGSIFSGLMDVNLGDAWMARANDAILALAKQTVAALKFCIFVPNRTRKGPKLRDNPGWICLGHALDPELCQYTVTGSTSAFVFSITQGELPPGTSLVQVGPQTAQLQGTPTEAGVFPFTLTARENELTGTSVAVTDTLYVTGIINPTLTHGTVGTAYSQQLIVAGELSAMTFTLIGSLPAGLSMSSTGLISGTPTLAGTSTFEVSIEDTDGNECVQSCSLNIIPFIGPGPAWSTGTTWGTAVFLGVGTIGTGSGSGDTFTMHIKTTVALLGTLTADNYYVGPVAHCNLHLQTLVGTGYTPSSIIILGNGVPLISKTEADFGAAGVYDFPFTISSFVLALGIPVHLAITIQLSGDATGVHPPLAEIEVLGTINNIP